MEYKAGQEYKMKYIDKDQKEHEATYTPDKDTNIAGMINGFKDKTKDFFKLLSIDNKSLDESRKITEEKDSGLKDALDNDVELFDDIYLYLYEYIKDEDTKSEIEDIIDKYTGIGGSAEDLDEDSEEYKSELEDCINEIEDLLNLNESKKITESEVNDFFFNQGLEKAKEITKREGCLNCRDIVSKEVSELAKQYHISCEPVNLKVITKNDSGISHSAILYNNFGKLVIIDYTQKQFFGSNSPEDTKCDIIEKIWSNYSDSFDRTYFDGGLFSNNKFYYDGKEIKDIDLYNDDWHDFIRDFNDGIIKADNDAIIYLYGEYNITESKKITESDDKPELADMLIEINRYYIDYIDNISFFIDLANVAGIDYDKVYDWYKSIKEDENDDLEESKKVTESDGENDNRIIYVGYAEKAYWKGTLKDYMKDEGNIDSDIIAKAKEDGYDISAHDIEHYDKDPHKDSQKSNLEVTNIRLSGQTEGLVAKATVKTDIGNIELNLLKLDGNYKCVINGFEPTEDEKSIINKYGQEALTKAVVDVYNDKSKVTESEDKYTYDKDEEEKLRKIFKDLQDGYSYGYDMKNVSYPIFKKVLSIGKSFGQKDYGTNYINVNYYGGTSHKITLDNLKWIMDKIFNMTPSKFLSKFIRNDKSTIKD